jgi:hypothetical protein
MTEVNVHGDDLARHKPSFDGCAKGCVEAVALMRPDPSCRSLTRQR